ncbi:MAG: ATP-binding protein [Vicinamibacterales bacterium]
MQDFEKLGAFYLGRPYDLAARAGQDGLVLYDSRDLVTHAVIIGMTGSGKTGLGIGLLEEAAIDGVPAIAIDPKGDLGNMLLTFPRLAPDDFRPWVNEDEATRKGLTVDAFATEQATLWKQGLGAWGQDAARIERLRQAVDLCIYTPGSSAGRSISILRSFSAPPTQILEDHELFAERLSTTVSGLLTLVGIDADPVRSREHILLSTVLGAAWKAGESLDLGALIARIQNPPVSRIGVLDVESFYPSKDRFELAMRLNGLLAAPGFASWLEGDPLDVDRLLFTASGKPRVSIVSIAHLGDAERMFFVALLMNEVLGWMRKQQGTTSLRAMLYMDEIAGYMPPVANPPSKQAMLTLLKQARAFGLGVVLSTQNPIDLDYKGLSNTGTWFLGRLQTEQDKARVLDGLEGALSGAHAFDRARVSQTLSGLGKRVFLMHNVHEDAPVVFETRWTLSYLRGPLTRDQIRALSGPVAGSAPGAVGATSPAGGPVRAAGRPAGATSSAAAPEAPIAVRPVLPPDVPQYFLPATDPRGSTRYQVRLWATAQVEFNDTKLDVRESRTVTVLAPFTDGPIGVDWDAAESTETTVSELETEPLPEMAFDEVPASAVKAKSYGSWSKDFGRWLFQTQSLDVLSYPELDLTSVAGESEREFRIRLQQALRERRDAETQRLRQKYAPKIAALEEKIRRAQVAVQKEQEQASDQKMQSVFTMGASVLGALLGRKVVSATNLGRAATAARGFGRARKESQDVSRAQENQSVVEQQLADLQGELEAEVASLNAGVDATSAVLQKVSVKPKKTHITVGQVALAWVPVA